MSPAEIAFLTMVVVSITVFAIGIAYASLVAGGKPKPTARHAPKVQNNKRISKPAARNEIYSVR
jgi:hypothetical protein